MADLSGVDTGFDAKQWMARVSGETRDAFLRNRRVMSFGEYLALFAQRPLQQVRSAAQYLRDVFEHFGTEMVQTSRGEAKRWKVFDCPWDGGKERLMGQEEVQASMFRLISHFAREGRTNRLILLHGPNGSAKSTTIACLERAMEHYSTLDDGALYKFNWIFPAQKLVKGGIGFASGGGPDAPPVTDTFAYLDDELVEAKIVDELRDHPLLLLPRAQRLTLIEDRLGDRMKAGLKPSQLLLMGDLSHRNRQIAEALLASYHGDLDKVLRHVQVERFYVSRRYRQATATVEPQLAVDAHARQLTMDRSLASLPPALQSLTLHEYMGELVDGNRGLLEYADLLKRPLDAFKYLLGTIEHGRISLDVANVEIDTVFVGSTNEGYLSAFKEIPEFQSFKGRMELVRAPYLLDHRVEQKIYDEHLRVAMNAEDSRHVAPHVSWVAAFWAVLTRMRKPMVEKYPKNVAELVAKLSPMDKAQLYAGEEPSEGYTSEQLHELRAITERIARESDAYPNYEGRSGASPREMKLLLLNASQSAKWKCVSPFAVFEELEELVKSVTVYEFLKQEPLSGGYHEHRKFVFQVRDRLIERLDEEVRSSMGLVDEARYLEQFARYVAQVSSWVKKEKIHNLVTGRDEAPSEDFMGDVERILDVASPSRREDFRREIIAKIGAWSIDNPRQKPDYERIFPRQIADLRDAFFSDRKKQVRKINEDLLTYLTDGPARMAPEAAEAARRTVETMKNRFGYCDDCTKDAVLALVKKRYS